MPELQSCYFCGEIGDALTAFDVVPADLADESSQRTVVVCSTCHRKLDTLLAPLRDLAVAGERNVGAVVEAGDTAEHAGTGDTDAESPLAPSDWADDTEDAGTGEADHSSDEQVPDEQTAHEQRGDEQDQSSADSDAGEITFAEGASESDDAADESDTSDATDEGIAFSDVDPERTDGTDDAMLGTDDSTLDGTDEETTDGSADDIAAATDDAAATGDADSEADAASDDSADADDSAEPSDDPPTGYRKVVRLLQNRAFPVERESFVDLASNAYELEEADVSASLDRLVERGALVESDGQLQKP